MFDVLAFVGVFVVIVVSSAYVGYQMGYARATDKFTKRIIARAVASRKAGK